MSYVAAMGLALLFAGAIVLPAIVDFLHWIGACL